jgi:Kef-type K+ transport system membrane component KefB
MDPAVSLIVIALAALVLPLLAVRLHLPAIVLEILFGIVVGPSMLAVLHGSELIDYLAELGFLLLMFLSGFEIDFGRIERQGSGLFYTGLAVFVATVGLAFWTADLMGYGPFFALLLATTSVGLVVPTLRGVRRSATRLGQAILISSLLADLLTLLGVTAFALVHRYGVGPRLLSLPALFLGIAVVLLVLKRMAWWFPERFQRLFAEDDPEEIGIRTCLALMFVFVGLAALLDVETIVGAFLAGTVFAMVFRHRGHLEQKLSGFAYGFFIPIFFIEVGMRFDLQAMLRPGVFSGALVLIAIAVAVKIVASSVLFVRGFSLRDVFSAGVLLSARLSLVIAIAEMGRELGLLDAAMESQVILLALVTSTLAPTLFRLLQPALQLETQKTRAT